MLSFVPNDHNILGVYPGKTITVGKIWIFVYIQLGNTSSFMVHVPATKKVGFTGVFSFSSKVHFKTRSVGPKFGKNLPHQFLKGRCGGKGESPPKNRRWKKGTKLRIFLPPKWSWKHQNLHRSPCSHGVGQFLLVSGSSIDFCLGKKISNDSFPQNVDQMTCPKFPFGYPALLRLRYPMSLKILNLLIYTLLETKWKMKCSFWDGLSSEGKWLVLNFRECNLPIFFQKKNWECTSCQDALAKKQDPMILF